MNELFMLFLSIFLLVSFRFPRRLCFRTRECCKIVSVFVRRRTRERRLSNDSTPHLFSPIHQRTILLPSSILSTLEASKRKHLSSYELYTRRSFPMVNVTATFITYTPHPLSLSLLTKLKTLKHQKNTDLRCGDWILGQVLGEGLQGKVSRYALQDGRDVCDQVRVQGRYERQGHEAFEERDQSHDDAEIEDTSCRGDSRVRGECSIGTKDAFAIRTQLCNGGELFTYLMYTGRFEEDRANLLSAASLLCGEDAENEFVHRDIKAENILLHDGILKLGDFGFARAFCDDHASLKKMQTQWYVRSLSP